MLTPLWSIARHRLGVGLLILELLFFRTFSKAASADLIFVVLKPGGNLKPLSQVRVNFWQRKDL